MRPMLSISTYFSACYDPDMPSYTVSRIGSIEGGYASEVSLAVMPDGTSAATASRDEHGLIQVTLWNLLPGGAIQQYSQNSADPQAASGIAATDVGEYVTAGQSTQGGHIKSIFWRAGIPAGDDIASQGHGVSVAAFPLRFALISPTPPPQQPTQVVYPEGYLAATAHVKTDFHVCVTSWFAGL